MNASTGSPKPPGDCSADLSIDQTLEMIEDSQCKVRLLDIREEKELPAGRIEGALHLPLSMLDARVEQQLPDKTKPVVLYCSSRGPFPKGRCPDEEHGIQGCKVHGRRI